MKQHRTALNMTRAELAAAAAVEVRTLELFELELRQPDGAWIGHVERVLAQLTRQATTEDSAAS